MKKIDKKKGIVIWVTGLPGSGKTTIANQIKKSFEKKYGKTVLFSGDDLRKIFNLKSYNTKGRFLIGRSYSKFVKKISNQNINIIFATVALFKKIHLWNRKNIKNYCEIYIVSKTKQIIKNKRKKLYFRYKKDLVGIDIKAEFPMKPDIKIANNFKRPINYLSKTILKKIDHLYEK